MSTNSGKGRIVAGIDGSLPSMAALSWAIDEARLRGLGLRIIHAFPTRFRSSGRRPMSTTPRSRWKRAPF